MYLNFFSRHYYTDVAAWLFFIPNLIVAQLIITKIYNNNPATAAAGNSSTTPPPSSDDGATNEMELKDNANHENKSDSNNEDRSTAAMDMTERV